MNNMKYKTMTVITGLIMMIAISGCPYESSVPLSNSCTSTIDSTLIGKWINPANDGHKDTIEIMKFNEHEYYIEIQTQGTNGINTISRGRGFLTLIRNQKFINYCELGAPEKFVFLKYEIRGNLLKISSVSDKNIKQPLNSSGEMFNYFSQNMDQPGFYETPDSAILVK
jgi:hypothetical protein